MFIAIDFDGTIVTHEYPNVGRPVPNALRVMKRLQEAGHKLILWTMRDGEELKAAQTYCEENGISFFGVNQNPDQDWSKSPKAYANIYIDDAALGCPTIYDEQTKRVIVDWNRIEHLLHKQQVLIPK